MFGRFALGLSVGLTLAINAQANGRFPTASLLAFDPADRSHLLLRTTFGLIDIDEPSHSGSWTCEAALKLDVQEDPMVALTADGRLVASTNHGIVTRTGRCEFTRPAELEGEFMPDLTLDRQNPHRIVTFNVRGLPQSMFAAQLYESLDDGASFQPLGEPLPSDLLPLSVDIAPNDSNRIYLTARANNVRNYEGVLLSSTDGGQHFEQFIVPETGSLRLPFLAAIHRDDAERLYVRVNDPEGNVLWLSRDGGASQERVFTARGRLLGFALSPDGEEIVFGGPSDGLWGARADGSELSQRSDATVSCLSWDAEGLYACGDAAAPYLLGKSIDAGANFSAVLTVDGLCEASGCAASDPLTQSCAGAWRPLAEQLGATCGVSGAGNGGASSGGASSGGASASGTPNEGGGTGRPGGGGCTISSPRHTHGMTWLLVAIGLGFRRRRLAPREFSGKFQA